MTISMFPPNDQFYQETNKTQQISLFLSHLLAQLPQIELW